MKQLAQFVYLSLALTAPVRSQEILQETEKPLPDLDAFLAEVRKHLRSDESLLSQYTFTERNVERHLDKNGQTKKEEEKTFEVYPALEGRRPYRKLISKNGRPVSPEERERQEREQRERVEKQLKKLRESPKARERELARLAKEREKESQAIEELFRLYEISMLGRELLDGHSTIVLAFKPRPAYKPRTEGGEILKKVAGRAWFNESEHELTRVEAELIETFKIGFGLVARLNKGARLVFQRRKVNEEIWLPARAHFEGSGRLLLLKGLRLDVTSEFSDYRKFNVSTSVSFPVEAPPR
jgi:hypothetical protein